MDRELLNPPSAPGYDDPLGMLTACHRRIERQLGILSRLQRHLPEHGCDSDARAAARGILRYFDTAAVNHHADEEASIFPRVLAIEPSATALVADLDADHRLLAARWRRIRPLLAAIAAGARANLAPREVAELRRAYDAHIAREESELIPLAKEAIDRQTLVVVGHEMARRRGVDAAR